MGNKNNGIEIRGGTNMVKFADIPQFTDSGNWECSYRLDSFIKTIDEWVEENELELEPDFQRGHVWNKTQRIKFVEFIR